MKRFLALALAALTILSLCACGDSGGSAYVPTGNGLTWDDPSDGPTQQTTEAPEQELTTVYIPADTYNPYFTTDTTNRTWMSLVYQGLFATDSAYVSHPILCESYWMSEDMQTYVLYIREDATFSDGTALTPADVLASLEFAMDSDMYRGRFSHVTAVFQADDDSIVVELDTPYENFPILLDVPILKQGELESTQPLGTGPFRMTSSAGGTRLVKVGTWWAGGEADLAFTGSAITLKEAESNLQVRDDFERADVDLVCADPGAPDYAAYRCDYELWDCETGGFLYLAVNMNSWIFGNDTIRWALTNVLNREAIVNEFYHGYARAATLAASPLSPYYDNILAAQYGYDPETFYQAVADAGLIGSQVRLLVNSADSQRIAIAKRVAAMLEESGLVVEVVTYTGDDYRYTLTVKNYDIHLGYTTLSPNMDLSPFFTSGGALSYGGISNARLSALCLDALANQGNYYNLLKEVADDARLVPILFETNAVYGERGVISALTPSRNNVFYYDLGTTTEDVLLDARKSYTRETEPAAETSEPVE